MSQTMSSRPAPASDQVHVDIELRGVYKLFGKDTAVRNVDLKIHKGEFFSILGPSGCGKTTTLRLISGFEIPSSGDVIIQGKSMGPVPAYRRSVNTVFQSYALFNHMTVWDNIAFGLRIQGMGKGDLHDRVSEALSLVKMEPFAKRYPAVLSGGQQQRVALARALVNRPAVMLLDEPLGALDLKLRKQMQMELSNLHRQLGITFVMVTHDQEEALSLSDRIAVMNHGAIEQVGTPSEIYDHPKTPFVADFIGDTNLIHGEVAQTEAAQMQVVTPAGMKVVAKRNGSAIENPRSAVVSIRPERIYLSLNLPAQAQNCYAGRVSHVMYLGTHVHCVVELNTGEQLMVLQPNRSDSLMTVGTQVYAHWAAEECLALEAA
ncbi:spermidine/putrescine ABC transporter ATP-binding protein [filamentous cyanobacterium CCP5]|nr:spermidine/putrescine ABC transporter ATP-binding protein [filamentous cyanobacterium CCP5]